MITTTSCSPRQYLFIFKYIIPIQMLSVSVVMEFFLKKPYLVLQITYISIQFFDSIVFHYLLDNLRLSHYNCLSYEHSHDRSNYRNYNSSMCMLNEISSIFSRIYWEIRSYKISQIFYLSRENFSYLVEMKQPK